VQEVVAEINDDYLTTRKEYVDVLEIQTDLLREIVGEEPKRVSEAPAEPGVAEPITEPITEPDATE